MELAGILVTLGALFLVGLAADELGRVTWLPRVTLLLLLGVAIGNEGFDLVPGDVVQWFDELSIVALTMVAFLLGGSLTRKNFARHGIAIFTISLAVVFATLVVVTFGLWGGGGLRRSWPCYLPPSRPRPHLPQWRMSSINLGSRTGSLKR